MDALSFWNDGVTKQAIIFAGGQGKPALRLLLLHDDADREFDYTAGAEKSLQLAVAQRWTVVSLKDGWSAVFADGGEM